MSMVMENEHQNLCRVLAQGREWEWRCGRWAYYPRGRRADRYKGDFHLVKPIVCRGRFSIASTDPKFSKCSNLLDHPFPLASPIYNTSRFFNESTRQEQLIKPINHSSKSAQCTLIDPAKENQNWTSVHFHSTHQHPHYIDIVPLFHKRDKRDEIGDSSLSDTPRNIRIFRMAVPTIFPYFNKLPLELRLMIWEKVETPYNTERPLVHSIRGFRPSTVTSSHPNADVSQSSLNYIKSHNLPFTILHVELKLPVGDAIFLSTTAPALPSILHACSESRRHILKIHKLEYDFGTYVNAEHDIFFLDYSRQLMEIDRGLESAWAFIQHKELIDRVEKIALPVREHFSIHRNVALLKPLLPSLKEVHFMYAHNDWNPRTMNNQYVDPRCTGRRINLLDTSHIHKEEQPEFVKPWEQQWCDGLAACGVDGQPIPSPTFHHDPLGFVDREDESHRNLEFIQRFCLDFIPDSFPGVFSYVDHGRDDDSDNDSEDTDTATDVSSDDRDELPAVLLGCRNFM
ncbi:hypothetical protein BDZ45DRAFT_746940 [Acephala macrosclerotiorum]|nr:hypothetical protein BDZ45DRAFT_746940 [Acephala macrosclerotiorum]